ncbi:hypothetical protein D3C85_1918000 [compost metagenome]
MATYPADVIAQAIDALQAFDFEEQVGMARVILTPVYGLHLPENRLNDRRAAALDSRTWGMPGRLV